MPASKLVKNATLEVYKGLPHGMCTTHPEVINPDLLAFIKGCAKARSARRGLSTRSSGEVRPPSPAGFGAATFSRFASEGWWAREDSNLQPSGYEPLALTIELQAPR